MRAIVAERSRQIEAVVPDATIFLTGSASVGGLDAADVDLVALVADVSPAASALAMVYPPLYREQWSDEWGRVSN